jgi:hypothetical protein
MLEGRSTPPTTSCNAVAEGSDEFVEVEEGAARLTRPPA